MHLVLFYEDVNEGQKMQFRFIKNGLLKGENCIYTTHDDDISLIENEMKANEIDVNYYYSKGLLHIYKIPNLFNHPKGVLEAAYEFIRSILCGLKPPFRLVGRLVDIIETKEQIETNLTLENVFHSKFTQFNGIVMCHYNINKSPSNTEGKWVEHILKNHHSAICMSSSGHGIAFEIN
jgi:antitoxin component YwqK of YwqJK toxin-antitoxin module